jgi:hypothetical protein
MGAPVKASVYAQGKGWLPAVECPGLGWASDYVGWLGFPITGIAFHNGYAMKEALNSQDYAVKTAGGWYPPVNWYNRGDLNNGMAGDISNPIIGFEFWTGAGAPGKPKMRLHFLGHSRGVWYDPQPAAAVGNSVLNHTSPSARVGWEYSWQIDAIHFGLEPW